MNDIIETATAVTGIAGELYKTVDETHKKQIGANTGAALSTLSAAVNNVLIPIAVVNFVVDKARVYLKEKFETDLAEAVSDIPPEALTEPKASIAAPVLQGLAFSLDEPDLKSMYLKLLASAMDGRSAETAHPAFVEIIKQSSAQDILLLNYLAHSKSTQIQAIDLYMTVNDKTGKVLGNIGPFILDSGLDYSNYMISVDNLLRLGVLKIAPAIAQSYDEIIAANIEGYKRGVHLGGIESYYAEPKSLQITGFGKSFMINCITPDLKGMPLHWYS
ncbi:DUF4393 domain-containing protein [Pseudomonas psychrophila]|uniref:DUF4393 domain-containing protein n=1 Tax=Pseudomonas psychrophila TaxID=122355 RepID=UPI00036E4CB8|nr:DUF4393 domain-containing protein [Pseudomonas psychrophila]